MSDDLVAKIRVSPNSGPFWAAWYKKAYPSVYYAAYRFARGNIETARDLAQETFTRFLQYEAIDRVTDEKHALSFLIKTCRRLAIDRDGRAREISLQDIPEYELAAPLDAPARAALELDELLGVLTPQERQMVQWTRDGFAIADIAIKLGISYTAAGVRLHRIRKRLQEIPGRT
jgi:RNA polymerase sigma factor (sigma-70 family)